MAADSNCLFCKIVAGEIPCETLFEDDAALAFMDIGPVAPGHALLIPKPHFETLADATADAMAATLKHLPALVRAVQAATGCEAVNVLQNNGRLAGQLVPHVHFHVIPRDPGGQFSFNWPASKYPEGRMSELAESIRSHWT